MISTRTGYNKTTLGFTKNSLNFHLASMLIYLNYSVDAWIAGVPMDNYGGASDMINKVGENHKLPSSPDTGRHGAR